MNKILYTAFVVLVTVWSIFFITREPTAPIQDAQPVSGLISQEQAQISAIQQVAPAVVGIANIQGNRVVGEGSGVAYRVENGNTYIVTNEHVITGAQSLEVIFNNGTQAIAEVVGSDVFTDLAVIRILDFEATRIATFGATEDLQSGQTVIAIGNPLGLTFAGSATMGIVSGHDRTVPVTINHNGVDRRWEMTVLQTDTAINPGNSGGALINLDGEVIGINSMKVSSQDVYGMSFSIPTYIFKPVIDDIEQFGRVLRPTLGVSIQALYNSGGVQVSGVVPGTMAQTMGVQTGDIITYIGDVAITSVMSFSQQLFTYQEGDTLVITVLRNGEELQLETTVVILD